MNGKRFVDTNILLYARDASEEEKQPIAEGLLRKLWETRLGRLSVQVLNEYYVNVTSKLDPGLSHEEAWVDVEQLQMWNPEPIDFGLMKMGYRMQRRYLLSWWDSLIVAAAYRTGAERIYSEDLSDGQCYDGIEVVNPFRR
jgi:predicted nucleic acid-binding protein